MDPDLYYKLIPSATFWTGLTIDYDTILSEPSVQSLLDLCLHKLVSNELHIRCIYKRVPPMFHFLLLKKAFVEGRFLSIIPLLIHYPEQYFDIPIPNSLRNWSVFLSNSDNNYSLMKPVVSFIPAVIRAFFTNSNSKLRILDMSQVFIPTVLLNDFSSLLQEDSFQMRSPNQTYTLRARFISVFEGDREILCNIKRALLKNKNINIEVIGLHIFSLSNAEPFLELFRVMDKEELLHFSLELSYIDIARFIPELQLFRNLQTLNLAYFQNGKALNSNYSTTLASALNSFVHLKQLSLRASCLSNLLRKLLKHNCDQIYTCSKSNNSLTNCCVVHRGKLEYLDVSSCKLRDDDFLVLQDFSFASSLKYLNLGHNYCDVTRLTELIEKIGSSLVVLVIEKCLVPGDQLKPLFSKFEHLFKLKSLNMKEMQISVEDVTALLKALEKMPELRQIALSKTDVFSDFSGKFEKLKCKNHLQVVWSQAKHNTRRPYVLRAQE